MMRGMFSAISGLKNHQVMLDVVANDIANVNTIGYKSARTTFKDSLTQLQRGASGAGGANGGTNAAQVGLGVGLGSIDNLMTGGALQSTGNPLDVAIQGEGFFRVAQDGSVSYIPPGGGARVIAGYLSLATFQNSAGLERASGNRWMESANSGPAQNATPGNAGKGLVAPGVIEMSNVDLAQSFTQMITAQRGFQANSRVISTSDEMLQDLVNLKR